MKNIFEIQGTSEFIKQYKEFYAQKMKELKLKSKQKVQNNNKNSESIIKKIREQIRNKNNDYSKCPQIGKTQPSGKMPAIGKIASSDNEPNIDEIPTPKTEKNRQIQGNSPKIAKKELNKRISEIVKDELKRAPVDLIDEDTNPSIPHTNDESTTNVKLSRMNQYFLHVAGTKTNDCTKDLRGTHQFIASEFMKANVNNKKAKAPIKKEKLMESFNEDNAIDELKTGVNQVFQFPAFKRMANVSALNFAILANTFTHT